MRGWKPGRTVVALAALVSVIALAGCRALDLLAEFDSRTVTIAGVAEIDFGSAYVSFLPAGGSLERISVTPLGGTELSASSFRVFDDTNGDGVWSEGEPVHQFVGTEAGDGFEVSDVTLTANQVRGWNRAMWQVDVVDGGGGEHVVSDGL